MADEQQGDERKSSDRKNWLPRCTRDEADRRIEYTRQLLVDGHNLSDIKRLLAQKYGLSSGAAKSYVRHARARNRPALHLKGDEAAVLSVTWWRQQQQQSKRDIETLAAELEKYIARESQIEAMIDADMTNDALQVEASRVARKINDARKSMGVAVARAAKAQDRIDMILGNKAPTKLAITDKDGNDIPRDTGVLETRLVALGFTLPTLPGAITDAASSRLATIPGAVRLEASARLLDSGDVSSD